MFVANCKYRSAVLDQEEQDSNLVLFSELNSPNIIPVTNFIKVQDDQGGDITGMSEIMGNLVVFMENSIWRLNIPSSSPTNWSLVESSKEMGCTSPRSITPFEGGILFANKDGVWLMSKNFIPEELSRPIRSAFKNEIYNKDMEILYSPKNKQVYVRGKKRKILWNLDLDKDPKQGLTWNRIKARIDDGSSEHVGFDTLMMDDEADVFTVFNYESSNINLTHITNMNLGGLREYSLPFQKRTGWIRLGSLHTKKIIKRINVRYVNNLENAYGFGNTDGVVWTEDEKKTANTEFTPTLKIYADGSEIPIYENTNLFNYFDTKEHTESLRPSVRGKYFSIELVQEGNAVWSSIVNPFILRSLEIEWK